MFEFISRWLTTIKRKRAERNDLCRELMSCVQKVVNEETALFLVGFREIDPHAVEQWKKLCEETLSKLSAVKTDWFWSVRGRHTLRMCIAEVKKHQRQIDQRIADHNQCAQDNRTCNQILLQAETAQAFHKKLFAEVTEFVDPEQGADWARGVATLLAQWRSIPLTRQEKTARYEKLYEILDTLSRWQGDIASRVHIHNGAVAKNRAAAAYALIGDVEGNRLDEQQLNCIVKKAHNHLVIAGAGTGKTTTVVGKIKYLLRSGQCRPEDILVLSFTNASAAEMSERICKETGVPIEASTFHKLGLNVIAKVNGIQPKITHINLHNFVKEQLELNMRSDIYLGRLGRYLLYGKNSGRSEFDFESREEYEEYLQTNPPATMNHEQVKSYGEMDIANFLAYNGIVYCYESAYKKDTRTEEYAQYYPDFYLPHYDIYIEYFGVNRNGEVPSYFSDRKGMGASQSYLEGIEWKRNIHKDNGTTMIECFAYERMEGTLEENLARQLEANGVVLSPKSAQEIWNQVSQDGEKVLDGVVELFCTVINLMKSNSYTIEDVRRKNIENGNVKSINDILWLIAPIANAYSEHLQTNGEIDFNDMITLATEYVAQGKFQNPYRFVIVDEYQDISKARYHLLKTMRESRDFDLFCVGDDWQSIYRFAGSDIGFILNFAQYWGPSEESKIETTYRFEQSLIDISGTFIMKNPAQKQKEIRGKAGGTSFALSEVNAYTEKYAVRFLAERLEELPENSTVFFIGRYQFDNNLLKDSTLFELKYSNQTGLVEVCYPQRPDLKMNFVTAHKSKGLQADYVVILNNKNSRMGFPSMIQDSPIMDLLLEKSDTYPHAEERRLFYVALTRAKKKVILLTVENRESVFVQELKLRYAREIRLASWSKNTCPRCGGRLRKIHGQFGDFWGCSNYRTKGCTYTRNIS